MNISQLRRAYHDAIGERILRVNKDKASGGYPNFADGSNQLSVELAWAITDRIAPQPVIGKIPGQTAGTQFEQITRDFLEQAFSRITHLRPGDWQYLCQSTSISNFVQYEHLDEIQEAVEANAALKAALGGNYVVGPDIVISRSPVADDEINRSGILDGDVDSHAALTPLRAVNNPRGTSILHAVVSCKWTLRNDRAQNTKTEVLNLIRHRKGHLPHIVAVTAEPMPSRIASLALGTGDLDCVYHFALNELREVIADSAHEDAADMLAMMVDGKRLRDISDLPFDLAA